MQNNTLFSYCGGCLHLYLLSSNFIIDSREVFLRQVFSVIDSTVHFDVLLLGYLFLQYIHPSHTLIANQWQEEILEQEGQSLHFLSPCFIMYLICFFNE